MPENFKRFEKLDFETFKALAKDDSLSLHEKVGFPNSYREGKSDAIFADITRKLSNLAREKQVVVDIGAGCGEITLMMMDCCERQGHTYIPIDSQEVLDQLPDKVFMVKTAAYYPDDCTALFEAYTGKVDAILTYSVFQMVFAEGNPFKFLDASLSLLADSGQMLVGDIPNISRRKRFFASQTGAHFHQAFMQTDELPQVDFNVLEPGHIDDAVMMGLVLRCRAAGYDAFILPQPDDLPMANRREDILICKP